MEMFFFLSLQRVSIKNSYVKYHGNCIFSIWHGLYVIFMFLKHSVPQLTDQASSSSSNIKNTCRNPRSTLKAIRSLRLPKQLCYQPQIRIPRLPFPVFFFSALLFVFSLHPSSQYRIGFMIYVPILTLVSITWTGYVQECRLLNVWASGIFRKTTH